MKTLFRLIVTLSISIFHYQNTSALDDGWEVEQRCFPEPSAPPAEWSFDGAILMSGHYGIHGFRAGWETPRVLVFLNYDFDLPGGALSPDGRWYASPYGHSELTETFSTFMLIDEIRVYSTFDNQIYRIPSKGLFFGEQYSRIIWLDNQNFLYGTGGFVDDPYKINQINPFTQEISLWNAPAVLSENYQNLQFLSPDHMRSIYKYEGSWILHDLENDQILQTVPLNARTPSALAWSPDSSHFAAEISTDPDSPDGSALQLALYNREGQQESLLMSLPEQTRISYSSNMAWSDDGQYLAFIVIPFYEDSNLYIADIQRQKIIDTCFAVNASLAWVPSTHNLLMIHHEAGVRQTPVVVSDVDQNTAFTVAYHEGFILGWRGD